MLHQSAVQELHKARKVVQDCLSLPCAALIQLLFSRLCSVEDFGAVLTEVSVSSTVLLCNIAGSFSSLQSARLM